MANNRPPLTDDDGEVRELTAEDFKHFRPASEVLPLDMQRNLGMRGRGPQKSPTKERITIRLTPAVVQAFRETGNGWQTRMDDALKDWLKHHRPA